MDIDTSQINDENKDDAKEELSEDVNNFKNQLEVCSKKRDEYLAGWQRAKADFINYKKEELSRLEEIARYGSEDLIKDTIGVLDSFVLGIAAMEREGPVEKGIYMIKAQLEDILKKRGLEKIKVKKGDMFDPVLHETIAEVEDESPPGTIVEEVETGYTLYDKIIRPARVKVAKNKNNS